MVGEGRFKRIIFSKPNPKNLDFTMPPAMALLHFEKLSLSRIFFPKQGCVADFFLYGH